MRDSGGIYKSATPSLSNHSDPGALFASQMLLRDQELIAAVVPSLCRHSDPAPAGEESRGNAAPGAGSPSCLHPESTNVGAGFILPRVSKGRAPGHSHMASIPKATENHPFLIAWPIASANHSDSSASSQEFNEIQFSNRLYIVCLEGVRNRMFFPRFSAQNHRSAASAGDWKEP
jgi:hypothetical protein